MNASGQQILLTVDGKLYQSFRPAVGRPWLKPDEVPMTDRFAGEAWLSPDDSLLLLTYFAEDLTPFYEPKRQLAVAQLDATGQYREAMPLKMPISDPLATNSNPSMALGERLLFFSSDRPGTLGGMDTYSVSFAKPADWPRADSLLNLGLPLNTLSNDEGISYFSEYSGHAYFHRSGGCAESKDLYRYHLGAEVFPENALRLAGLVIDEDGDPVGGGFMEFTPNFQLNVHARPISPKGTYTYTVADSTEVVRLFPEIPGYYSERDTTHYLAQVAKGEILRDTFRLISFGFIRKNFKLEHSTFFEGTARFNQPEKAYPEITRLAKIAVRMGADLELVGHTDRVGTPAENVALSLNRAQSVKNYLVEKCGFDPTRIRVVGKGDQAPICPNDTEEGRRCNRRIEIFFIMPELPE
jgi:outer membrane protein OmpA-like peptidoglycan-associated protein